MRLGKQTPPIYLLSLELIRSTDWHHGTATGSAENAGRRDHMVVAHVHGGTNRADNLPQLHLHVIFQFRRGENQFAHAIVSCGCPQRVAAPRNLP